MMRAISCIQRILCGIACTAAAPCPVQCPPAWLPGGGYPGVRGAFITAFEPWDPDGPGPLRPRLAFAGIFDLAGDSLAAGRGD